MPRFEGGWFKLYRSAVEGDIGSNAVCFAIFIRLLSWASLKPTTVRFDGKPRTIPRGTVVTGIRDLAAAVGCARQTAHNHLKYLETRDTIRREVGTEGTLVTIVNFERYQGSCAEVGQALDAEGTPIEREIGRGADPSEEVKKERKKNAISTGDVSHLWRHYAEKLEKMGMVAVHEGAKSNSMCNALIDAHGVAEAERMVDAFIGDNSPFLREKAWPLALLVSQQQQYLNSPRAKPRRQPLHFGETD